ncbi:MAG: DUF6398 domain-containing protein [Desulfobacterales bacterium]
MSKDRKSEKVPKEMQETFENITRLSNEFCKKFLNEEYAQLIRYAAAALCRKRPSPLAKGRADSWACGITHALGMVNFLYDKTHQPFMNASELYEAYGVSRSTGLAKSKAVRDLLKMSQLDLTWCLPSRLDDNPLTWLIMVNGFIVDSRQMPREVQEEAFEKGFIPCIPDDRKGKKEGK